MNLSIVEKFFSGLKAIRERYLPLGNKVENSFNIFNILGLYNREVKHSAFIAEMLNPKGSHQQGDSYLQLFYQRIGLEYKGRVSVFTEYSFANGRIDIYVKAEEDSYKSIIIENKIEAGDQNKQLWRYRQFDPKAKLLYLTLNGKNASSASVYKLKDFEYQTVSYEFLIVSWLEDCLKIVKDTPILRETIRQYLNLIKQLTGQTLLQEEKMDIAKLVCENDDYLGLFFHLINNQNAIYQKLEDRLWTEIVAAADNVGLKVTKNFSLLKQYSVVTFEMNSQYTIILSPQNDNLRNIVFGIHCKGGVGNISLEKKNKIREKYARFIEQPMREASFIAHNYWTPYKNWSTSQYENVLNGKFRDDLIGLLKKMKALIESL